MSYRDDNIWSGRQQVTRSQLLWQALDLLINALVWAHYEMRRNEHKWRPATRQNVNDAMRYAKGIAVFWHRWMLVTYPRPQLAVPADVPQPNSEGHESMSAGHAQASPYGHDR